MTLGDGQHDRDQRRVTQQSAAPDPGQAAAPDGYPAAWAVDATLADGETVHIRPIRPDDAPAHRLLHAHLSPESVYSRFFAPRRELSEAEVVHFTTVDYGDRMAFVVFLREDMIAVGRYDRLATSDKAEVAFSVVDAHQGRGIGSLLLEYLAAYARDKGITRFIADTLSENRRMLDVFHAAGFHFAGQESSHGVTSISFDLEPTGESMAETERRAWTSGVHSIERILRPRSIAVIGAGRDPTSIGHSVVRNLVAGGFTGPVYPINPNATAIDGVPCHASVEAIDGPIDVAVLAVPAAHCLDAVDACARKGVHGLVVISSGFAEVGAAGAAMQKELLLRAHRAGMRVVGPNCFGVINTAPDVRLDATFASRMPVPGRIAFASQSGALGVALLEQSASAGLGLSSFVSTGNKADVSSNDLLRYWSQDGETHAILLYLESFGNPRAFARVAPVVSRRTPIVVVKSGRSASGVRAAASHTAAMASPDRIVDALFRQAGVIRVDTLEELIDCGTLLAGQPALSGRRLAVIGNAGGAAVLAADACAAVGLDVPELGPEVQSELRELIGPNTGVSNPVDLGAGTTPAIFGKVLQAALRSPEIDGAVVILAPVAYLEADDVAREVAGVEAGDRPVVFIHLGSGVVPEALRSGARSIPCYAFPERAIRALGRIAEHSEWRRAPVGTVPDIAGVDTAGAREVVERFLADQPDGGWLPPDRSEALLRAFGIPVVAEIFTASADAARAAARRLGLPVALKATGRGIVHKSELGAVRLGLGTGARVWDAYNQMATRLGDAMQGAIVQKMVSGVETIAGVVSDPLFGPVVMFGSGGTAVELLGDRVFRTLPLTDQNAADMVRSIRGAPLLLGHRGAPVCDVAALEDVLLRVARLAEDVPQLAEMDLNPLMAMPKGACVVDHRVRIVPWRNHPEHEVRRLP